VPIVLDISREFVQRWCDEYDNRFRGGWAAAGEMAIRQWLSGLPEPKYLNKQYFVRLGHWKSQRQMKNYEKNDEVSVKEATKSAYEASDELLKLHILKGLKGVGVAVAAAILHYLHPDQFPIFDYHARTTLKKAGMWNRDVDDASDNAWQEYVATMRELSGRLGVSLRELDKALFAYDKWGTTGDPSLRSG